MIGNDIIDLKLAKLESNWQRKGFLDKIFTKNEQILIQKSENQENAVWNLWSRKEAVYKIWNRETGIRKYNPIKFECLNLNLEIGKVQFESKIYFTKTQINTENIHTIAVSNLKNLNKIKILENFIQIEKVNGFPFIINSKNKKQVVSKSHHGRFESLVTISI